MDGITNSLSGIQSEQKRVDVSAHNSANQNTDGFEKQRVASREAAAGGVETRVDSVALTEEAMARSAQLSGSQNDVDPSEEAVSRIQARESLKSNVKAIRAQDQMQKGLLDELA